MIMNRMQIAAMDRAGEVCATTAQEVAAVRAPVAVATSDEEKRKVVGRYFDDEWAVNSAMNLLHDYHQLVTDQGGWFSVADRLPEHEQTVLCHGAASREPWTSIACFHRDGSFYDPEIGDELYPPTHWQPLPAAPTLLGVADGDAVGGKSGGAT